MSRARLIPVLKFSDLEWIGITIFTNRLAIYIDILYLGRDGIDEQDILISVYALSDEIFAQSPHVIAPQILVLKDKLYIFCATFFLVDLVGQ